MLRPILLMVPLICPWSQKYQSGVPISELGLGSDETPYIRYLCIAGPTNQIALQKFFALIQNK